MASEKHSTVSQISVDKWQVSDIVDALQQTPVGKRKISIPPFQRGLRWTEAKRKDLVASIKSRFPIGSLLMYDKDRENGKELYSVVDGLQRCHTLKDYDDNMFHYLAIDDVPDSIVDKFVTEFSPPALDREVVRQWMLEWLWDRKGFDNAQEYTGYYLAEYLRTKANRHEMNASRALVGELDKALDILRAAMDVSKSEVPVVVFSGDQAKLPDIFEKLNTGGTKLNKYEIFAATWKDDPFTISDDEIVQAIRNKYRELEDAGLEVEEKHGTQPGTSKQYSYFEWLFGLGKVLRQQYPLLFGALETEDKASTDSIAFVLATVCAGLALNQMGTLPSKLADRDLEDFTRKLKTAIKFVNDCISPILRLRLNNERARGGYHSEYQIASLVGFVFHQQFEWMEDRSPKKLKPTQEWAAQRAILKETIKQHYLYDIIREQWRGSGDSRLKTVVFDSEEYLTKIDRARWEGAFNQWFADQTKHVYTERPRPDPACILFLKYLYAPRISVYEDESETFHVEHLIPIGRLKQAAQLDNRGYAMSCIANLALLPASLNLRKGDRTISEHISRQIRLNHVTEGEGKKELKRYLDFTNVSNQRWLEIPTTVKRKNVPTYAWFTDFMSKRFEKLVAIFFDLYNIR